MRTIEILQRIRIFKVHCYLKAHNAHLKLTLPISEHSLQTRILIVTIREMGYFLLQHFKGGDFKILIFFSKQYLNFFNFQEMSL